MPRQLRRWCKRNLPTLRMVWLWSQNEAALHRRYKLRYLKKLVSQLYKVDGIADFSSEGGKLYIHTPDKFKLWFYKNGVNPVLWHGRRGYSHEKPERALLETLIIPSSHILDIGAGCGLHAMTFARAESTVTVHAFEPIPATFEALQENVAKNGYASQVHCNNIALGDKEHVLTFSTLEGPYDHVIMPGEGYQGSTMQVPSITVDSYVVQNGITVSGMKIDVEGYETYVLEGACKTIMRDRPWIFCEAEISCVERRGGTLEDLKNQLESFGYSVHWVDGLSGVLTPFSEKPGIGNNFLAQPK